MASSTMNIVGPLPTPLPAAPGVEPFSELNWRTLMAIMNTVIPSIHRQTKSSDEFKQLLIPDAEYNKVVGSIKRTVAGVSDDQLLDVYFDENASSIPRFEELLRDTFNLYVREEGKKGMAFILSALK